GDPSSTRTTPTESHDFGSVGTFIVVLTVTDESGQTGTTSQSITVTAPAGGSAGAPTANFTSSPTAPVVNELVVFDSSSTTVPTGRTITDYAWNFGDDTPIIHGDNRIISHNFARAGTFIVNLVVTDNTGATGQRSAQVVVGSGDPIPVITASPTTAAAGTQIGFSSAGSKTFGGATIASYSWNFGDPGSGVNNTSALANPTHTFAAAGTYTVRLTITDSQGRVGTVTISITIT
ncbi:MAG TPA: PKD domain-containing protein, partial [Vicinamibacterales bacterium]|nr:PKD domain-containing protein [Vicinamibacterales bacterium]